MLPLTIWVTFDKVQNQSPTSVFYQMKRMITLFTSQNYCEDEIRYSYKALTHCLTQSEQSTVLATITAIGNC